MFETKKILQMIAYLLSLNNNEMNLLKLIKELYLIDRESIDQRDTSISGDVYFSLPHGPVLSATLNLLNDLDKDNRDNPFADFLETKQAQYYPDIVLKNNPGDDYLSIKDKQYIEKISKQFQKHSPMEIENYTHKLPEWTDPKGSNIKIRFQDIMRALDKTEQEIIVAKQEYEQISNLNKHLEAGNAI
jgi:hypothetical protein